MKFPRINMRRLWLRGAGRNSTGSLTRRMIGVSAIWIVLLLGLGGFTLDRVLASAITRNFDAQLDYVLTAMIASAEIGPEGEVLFNRTLADQRFIEPYSGLYYQVSGGSFEPFISRSLWDRRLDVGATHTDSEAHLYDSDQFAIEKLRIIERDVRLPGSAVRWRFQVAQNREVIDEQIDVLRQTMLQSFGLACCAIEMMATGAAHYDPSRFGM